MHTLNGLIYYDTYDNDEVLEKAYIDMRVKFIQESTRCEEIDNSTLSTIEFEAANVVKINKQGAVYLINKEIGKEETKRNETHWVEFLNTLGFRSYVVEVDVWPMQFVVRNICHLDGENIDKIMRNICSCDGTKCLIIERISILKDRFGRSLSLSDPFDRSFNETFGHLYNQTKTHSIITYGPSLDTYMVSTITRLLHLLL